MSALMHVAMAAESVIVLFGVIFAIQFTYTAPWWKSWLGVHIFLLNLAITVTVATSLMRAVGLVPPGTGRAVTVAGLVLVAALMVAQVILQAIIHARGERRGLKSPHRKSTVRPDGERRGFPWWNRKT